LKDIIGTARVIAKPLLFKQELLETTVGAGLSLREILGNDSNSFIISLNGVPVDSSEWELTFVSEDDLIVITGLPAGGDNSFLRLLAVVVVFVIAFYAGPALAGAWGGSEAFWTSAVLFAGMIAVSLLLPPTLDVQGTDETKRLNSLTGTRNRFLPFGTIPSLYGRHRLYPPIASIPVTEIIGEDQYLNMIYCIGLGDYDIDATTVKIGETLATDFEDIDVRITDQPDALDIFELQHNLVLNQDSEPGDSFTRTTQPLTESISLDLILPAGLIFTNDVGDTEAVRIHFSVEYRASGSTDPWVSITVTSFNTETRGEREVLGTPAVGNPPPFTTSAGTVLISTLNSAWVMVHAQTRDPFRIGVRWPTGSAGTWDVRVTRQRSEYPIPGTTRDSSDANWFSFQWVLAWSATRSIKPTPAILLPAGTATFMTLRVRATDQLNGIIDTFNVIATRKLRSWNKGTQLFNIAAATRDPAWAFLDVLTGLGNARPIDAPEIDKIILDDLADWATENTVEGRFYDEVVDYKTSVFRAITRAASVGRASVSNRDGKWTVILEQATPTPVQYFTPRNSWGFNSVKRFVNFPHAFKVRFNSEDSGYQEDEMIVFDDGFDAGSATEFEVLQLAGITDADFAWKTARYIMAAARLRPEVYTFNADVEHIVAQRGDHIKSAHDIPLWGNSYGRIKDVVGNVITTDEAVTLDGGTNYVMRVRLDDGTSVIEDLTLQGGPDLFSHTFTPVIPAGIQIGDLYMIGEVGSETQDLLIIAIDPQDNLTARLTCLDLSPAILDADTGVIPPFNPNITLPPDPTTLRPSPPFGLEANSDQNVFFVDGSGVLIPRIIVTWQITSNNLEAWGSLTADLRYRIFNITEAPVLGTWMYISTFNASQAFINIDNVEIGLEYEIQMRTVTEFGAQSVWSNVILHTVGGATRNPPAVDGLTAVGVAGGIIATADLTSIMIRNSSYIELHVNTVNDRDAVSPVPQTLQFILPSDLNSTTILDYFIPYIDTVTRFMWARVVDIYLQQSIYFPVSPTAGISATPLVSTTTVFYIKPTNGTAIHNGTGTLTVEAHKIEGGVDTLLSTGTIKLFDPGDLELTVANGYQTGSDGYTGILDSGNISNDIVITMKDGVGGTVLDTITLVDIADGLDGGNSVNGFIEPENGLAWRREGTDGPWTPSQLTTDLDVTFVQGGSAVARQGYRLTLNSTDGTITGAVTTHPLGDLNISRITITPTGSGTETFSVKFDYSFGGDDSSVSETVNSVTGGGTGEPGQHVTLIYDDLDTTQLAAGQSRYAMLTARGTDTSGSQNNFHLTDAILINKKDKAGLNFTLFFSDLNLGDRITYRISSTRWFIFSIDEIFDIVGTGTAEAYKFGVVLIDSVDPDPTVTIPTTSGTDVSFIVHSGLFDRQQQPIIDPDFDLSSSLYAAANVADTRRLWNEFTQDSVTSGIPDGTSTITMSLGTGPNGSNTVRFFKDNLTTGIPPRTSEGYFWHGHRIRTNLPSFDIKIRWRNNGVNTFSGLVWRMLGFDLPRGGSIGAQANSTFTTFAVTGTTWQESTIHVETDGNVDAQYWMFRVDWFDQSPTTEEEIEIDSIFVFQTSQSFGTTVGSGPTNKVQAGLVPESDTSTDSGKVLQSDGTWTENIGAGAGELSELSDVNTSTPTNRNVLIADGVDWESRRFVAADVAFAATDRFLARTTTGAGDGEELTGTQATVLLDVFTSGLKGLAPLSGGGSTNFLRADGVWAVPTVGDTDRLRVGGNDKLVAISAAQLEARGSIVGSNPPVSSDNGSNTFVFTNSDDTVVWGALDFGSGAIGGITNNVRGQTTRWRATTALGGLSTGYTHDPDGAVTLFYTGGVRFATVDFGIRVSRVGGGAGVYIEEDTAVPALPSAGDGVVWVKNDVPNTLWFTDDGGADHQLGVGGIADGTGTDNTLRWSGSAWIEESSARISSIGAITALSYGGIIEGNLLDKTAVETITNTYTFEGLVPKIRFNETDAILDEKRWNILASGGQLIFRAENDAESATLNFLVINRSGMNINTLNFITAAFDISGDLTAQSYGGITEIDLVDKGAIELITGAWTFSGTTTVPEVTITSHEAALAILESQITDGSILARLASTETISGVWTHSALLITDASDATAAGFRLPHGVAPTVPVNGDMWTTTASIFARINGATQDLLAGAVPTLITVANEVVDTTSFPLFVTAPTGNLGPKTNAGLTFNAVTADFSATLIAGIANADLVDKSAIEAIAGNWTFSGITIVPEATVIAHEAALTILESQITDAAILARVAASETISGLWTHSGRLVTDDSTTVRAGFNIPTGIAPTVPVQGDIWVTATDAFIRINGVSKSMIGVGIADGTGVDNTVRWNGSAWVEEVSAKISSTGAITALSYGGITEGNLLDKSAIETITGNWDFDGLVKIKERVSAGADTLAYGQPWVKIVGSANELWFTNDLGTDFPVAPLFPETTEETAASLTITDYHYPVGHMFRYGVVGDDATDNTAAFNAILIAGGFTIRVPAGIYQWTSAIEATDGVLVGANTHILCDAGVTMRNTGMTADRGWMRYRDVGNCSIEGNNSVWEYITKPVTGEFRHIFALRGANNITIRDVAANKSGGDGFTIGNGATTRNCSNIYLENISADDNRRGGLSITAGKDIVVNGAVLRNSAGTAPEFGLDIEPNSSYDLLEGIVLNDIHTKSNTGAGLIIDIHNFPEAIGTHDGGASAATLSDSGESWATNEFVGRVIVNLDDGSSGPITANTATTITAVLTGGTDNDWDVGDSYNFMSTVNIVVQNPVDIESPIALSVGNLNVKQSFTVGSRITGSIKVINPVGIDTANFMFVSRNYDALGPLIEIEHPKAIRPNSVGSTSASLGAAFIVYAPAPDTGAANLGNVRITDAEVIDDRETPLVTNYLFVDDVRTVGSDIILDVDFSLLNGEGQPDGNQMVDFNATGNVEDIRGLIQHDATISYTQGWSNYVRTVTNEGAVATVVVTLDALPTGWPLITFEVKAAQLLRITPDGSSNIQPGSAGVGKSIDSNEIGAKLTLRRVSSTEWRIVEEVGYWFRQDGSFDLFNDTRSQKSAIDLSATDLNWAITGTADLNITGLTGDIVAPPGRGFKVIDSGSGAQITRHDGTDVNTTHAATVDWNISGITAIKAGAVDADFDAITGTSYGGILEANLVSKIADASISGGWTFSGINFQSGNPFIFVDGTQLRFGSGSDVRFDYDNVSTDFTLADTIGGTTWNITGFADIAAGTVDADFDAITATSYGAILEANLIDKTVAETFSGTAYTFQAVTPRLWFDETDAAADNQLWSIQADAETFRLRAWNDATSVSNSVFDVSRTGAVIDGINFPTAVTADSFGGITEGDLVDKTVQETITDLWTFSDSAFGAALQVNRISTTGGSAIAFSNTDGIKGYAGFSDDGSFNVWEPGLIVEARFSNQGSLFLREQAAADTDVTAYGQIWMKNTNPIELWFTGEDGVDHQIAFV